MAGSAASAELVAVTASPSSPVTESSTDGNGSHTGISTVPSARLTAVRPKWMTAMREANTNADHGDDAGEVPGSIGDDSASAGEEGDYDSGEDSRRQLAPDPRVTDRTTTTVGAAGGGAGGSTAAATMGHYAWGDDESDGTISEPEAEPTRPAPPKRSISTSVMPRQGSGGGARQPHKKTGVSSWFSFGKKKNPHLAPLRALQSQLSRYAAKLRKEGKRLLALQRARRVEHEALVQQSKARVGRVYDDGLFTLLPKFRQHAALRCLQMRLLREVGVASLDVIRQRLLEANALLQVVELQLEAALKRDSPPPSEFVSPVDPAFFKPAKVLIQANGEVSDRRSAVEDVATNLAEVDAELTELQPQLSPRSREVLQEALLSLLEAEQSAKTAESLAEIRAAELEAQHDAAKEAGDEEAAAAAHEELLRLNASAAEAADDSTVSKATAHFEEGLRRDTFASICCDNRHREGRLLTKWCARVLGDAAAIRKDMMTSFNDHLEVKGELSGDDLLDFERLLAGNDDTLSGNSLSRSTGGAVPRRSRRESVGLLRRLRRGGSATEESVHDDTSSGAGRRRPRSSFRRRSARRRASGDTVGARAMKPPPPAVVLAFLKYFTQFIAESYEVPARYHKVLRGLVNHVVFPLIHTLCFEGFNKMTSKRDGRFVLTKPIVRAMSAKEIGINESYCRPHLVLDTPAETKGRDSARQGYSTRSKRKSITRSAAGVYERGSIFEDVEAMPAWQVEDGDSDSADPHQHRHSSISGARDTRADSRGGVDEEVSPKAEDSEPSTRAPDGVTREPTAAEDRPTQSDGVLFRRRRRKSSVLFDDGTLVTPYENADHAGLFADAVQHLSGIEEAVAPAAMLARLMDAIKSAMHEAGQRAGDPAVGAAMDAEALFPVLVFMASRASWSQPHATLAYLENFAIGASMRGGMEDYYVTTFAAAVAWICHRPIPDADDRGVGDGATATAAAAAPARLGDAADASSDSEGEGDDGESAPTTSLASLAADIGSPPPSNSGGLASVGTGHGSLAPSAAAAAVAAVAPPTPPVANGGAGSLVVEEEAPPDRATEKEEMRSLGKWLGQQEVLEDTLDSLI